MAETSRENLLLKIQELENRIEDSEQLIDAIKAGEVDAFAINKENESEVYTLQSGDYAYRVLIEEFGEGAINVTEDGLIVYTNTYFFELLQLPYEKVIGASIFDFIDPACKKSFAKLFKKSLKGKSKGEVILITGEGSVPVYVSLTSLQPKLATVGIIISDLSEKKKHEDIILAYQNDLEKKNLELVQSNTELASFAYIASHDLQEPLRKIQTFATRISEKEFNNLTDSGKDHFSRMQASAKRMQRLIEDLLAYSHTNNATRSFECTDLNQIVEEVLSDLKEDINQKKAMVEIGKMCNANIIPFQIRQVLNNLISNSLKFSRPSHLPCISIASSVGKGIEFNQSNLDTGKKYCHIHYADNGIGFDQKYSERIFELFQRLHGKTEYQGTGIGLAIVKKIVENHDGFIFAKGDLNVGATFDIYLPYCEL